MVRRSWQLTRHRVFRQTAKQREEHLVTLYLDGKITVSELNRLIRVSKGGIDLVRAIKEVRVVNT